MEEKKDKQVSDTTKREGEARQGTNIMLNKILCFIGVHDWITDCASYTRACIKCGKQQEFFSAGFPAYLAEWRNKPTKQEGNGE